MKKFLEFVDAGKDDAEKVFRIVSVGVLALGVVLTIGLSFAGLEAVGILISVLATGWTVLAWVMQEDFRNFGGFTKLWAFLAGCYAVGMLPFGPGASVIAGTAFAAIWLTVFVMGTCLDQIQKKKE